MGSMVSLRDASTCVRVLYYVVEVLLCFSVYLVSGRVESRYRPYKSRHSPRGRRRVVRALYIRGRVRREVNNLVQNFKLVKFFPLHKMIKC